MPDVLIGLLLLVVGYGIGYNLHQIALERRQGDRIPVKINDKD